VPNDQATYDDIRGMEHRLTKMCSTKTLLDAIKDREPSLLLALLRTQKTFGHDGEWISKSKLKNVMRELSEMPDRCSK